MTAQTDPLRDRLRLAVDRLGWTQDRIAREIGVRESTLNRKLRGRKPATLRDVLAVERLAEQEDETSRDLPLDKQRSL